MRSCCLSLSPSHQRPSPDSCQNGLPFGVVWTWRSLSPLLLTFSPESSRRNVCREIVKGVGLSHFLALCSAQAPVGIATGGGSGYRALAVLAGCL